MLYYATDTEDNEPRHFTAPCQGREQCSHSTHLLTRLQENQKTPYTSGSSHGTTPRSAPGWQTQQVRLADLSARFLFLHAKLAEQADGLLTWL
jgi:hypothetical protein